MSQSLKELIEQRAALDKAIVDARAIELGDAVVKVRELIAQYGLTVQDVFPQQASGRTNAKKTGAKVAPKYRNPATDQTWTGRGKPPVWIAGQDRDQFLIN